MRHLFGQQGLNSPYLLSQNQQVEGVLFVTYSLSLYLPKEVNQRSLTIGRSHNTSFTAECKILLKRFNSSSNDYNKVYY